MVTWPSPRRSSSSWSLTRVAEERRQRLRPGLQVAALVDLGGHRAQLQEVLDPTLGLDGVLCLQLGHVARAVPRQGHQVSDRALLVDGVAQLVDDLEEPLDAPHGTPAQPRDALGLAGCLQQ